MAAAPLPEPDSLAFASSTASTISAPAYRAVEALRQELIEAGLAGRLPEALARTIAGIRRGILEACGRRGSGRHRGGADAIRHRWRVCGLASRAPAGERAPGQPRDRARGDRARGCGTRLGACISRARRRPARRLSGRAARRASDRRRSRSRRSRSGRRMARPAGRSAVDAEVKARGAAGGRPGGPLPRPSARGVEERPLRAEPRGGPGTDRAPRRADRRGGRRLPDAPGPGVASKLSRGRLDGAAHGLQVRHGAAVLGRPAGPGAARRAGGRARSATRPATASISPGRTGRTPGSR